MLHLGYFDPVPYARRTSSFLHTFLHFRDSKRRAVMLFRVLNTSARNSGVLLVGRVFSERDPEGPYLNQLSAIHLKLIYRGDSDFR